MCNQEIQGISKAAFELLFDLVERTAPGEWMIGPDIATLDERQRRRVVDRLRCFGLVQTKYEVRAVPQTRRSSDRLVRSRVVCICVTAVGRLLRREWARAC